MPLYRRKVGGMWYIDIRRGRRGRTRRSTGTTERRAAQRQHDELAAKLWKQRQSGRQLSDALLAWLDARPRNPSEIRALRLIRRIYPDRPLYDVTEASLIEAFASGRSAAAYDRLMTIIRAALKMAERAEWLDRAPHIARRRGATPEFRWLTRGEWRKLRRELAVHVRPLADFALATGLRWSNVAQLRWEQVSLSRRLVTIQAARAKGRKPLSIPLSPAAFAVLRSRSGKREGFVFGYYADGQPLETVKTAWKAAVRRSGIAPARWHDLRHTWASWHVQNGTPLAVLQQLGGWATLEQVMIYAHLAPSHVARYAGNAERRAKKAA